MRVKLIRRAGVAVLAAAAFIMAASAAADYPTLVSSFRMSGTSAPYACGIYTPQYSYYVHAIFYEGPGRYSFRTFTTAGSLIATYPLAGGVTLGDADHAPDAYPDCFAVVDNGTHQLKVYTTTGSSYGVIRTLPNDVVAYACGGHVTNYIYLGTSSGIVYRYTPTWSLLNSFWTGVPTADLAAGHGYAGIWGDWVVLGPSQAPAGLNAYRAGGSFHSSFPLPGIASRGSTYGGHQGTTVWCLRNLGTSIWAYEVDTGPLMAVAPASLGKVKALFR